MKAIVVMFDTLNRQFLPPYGAEGIHAPNFTRLAARTVQFDNCYGGSMPCMPARREMHTGRYNFLHRGWGPLEPFDDSVPQLMGEAGIYTHLVTDHQHYWLDGGATYHPRFRSFEFFRGQEGDEWKGQVADPDLSNVTPYASNRDLRRQDVINRGYLADEADHPQTQTFDAGLHFIDVNKGEDDWMLQIETFDPHEPFFSYEQYHALYRREGAGVEELAGGIDFDWPDYKPVTESPEEITHLRDRYSALLSMCDASLGRVLDAMDEHDLWRDTMLIVCTDHGLLLGEHDWLGKRVPPFFDETIHTPLFVWDPRSRRAGERSDALVQTIDFGPTLLDYFGLPLTPSMQGRPLREASGESGPIRDAALFGIHGGHVNVTDGRYVYMRACATEDNLPLAEYTLMPTNMRGRFSVDTLAHAELVPPLSFTKGLSVLRVPALAETNPRAFGTMLFDLQNDPGQKNSLVDDKLELRMAEMLVRLMRDSDAPPEQYERLGLPQSGPVTADHLLLREAPNASPGNAAIPIAEFAGTLVATRSVRELLANDDTREVLRAVLGPLADSPLPQEAYDMTLVDIATVTVGMIPVEALRALSAGFGQLRE
ncbi:MAG: sulfatase-like hydrolase/transferase [Microbacteriaceae bacterium]